ncbi:MAG: helix-turn-helix transcriptional regulator [Actinomycetota bacterium]|nr:helix-turn-helix transcriptional regulator [Actinomycetota bacterium]
MDEHTGGGGGAGGMVVVVSGRRLIAEALRELLADRCGHEHCHAVHDDPGLGAVPLAIGRSAWLIDLDDPGAGPDAIVATMPPDLVRRLGFYDTFTAGHADAAFALRLTVLFPLASDLDHIHDAVFGDRQTSSATEARGLTRRELARLAALTPRETEVLRLLAGGLSVSAIARLLGITTHTVDTHKRRTFQKLDVQQQGRAVALAVEAGLVLPD